LAVVFSLRFIPSFDMSHRVRHEITRTATNSTPTNRLVFFLSFWVCC
jgi:hypothetical protein